MTDKKPAIVKSTELKVNFIIMAITRNEAHFKYFVDDAALANIVNRVDVIKYAETDITIDKLNGIISEIQNNIPNVKKDFLTFIKENIVNKNYK